ASSGSMVAAWHCLVFSPNTVPGASRRHPPTNSISKVSKARRSAGAGRTTSGRGRMAGNVLIKLHLVAGWVTYVLILRLLTVTGRAELCSGRACEDRVLFRLKRELRLAAYGIILT